MLIPITLLATALLIARAEPGTPALPHSAHEMRPGFNGLGSSSDPPATEVVSGDEAPNFSYQGWDGRWRHLHDVLDQGHVLLVFGPADSDLLALERDRQALLAAGVVPVAVLDVKPGRAWSTLRRLELRYSVLADPRRVIAAQFNAIQANSGYAVPAWFVIDSRGRVRGLQRGRLPGDDYLVVASRALALPLPGVALPASR